MQTATLVNKTRQSKVINLDHPAFRDKKYGFKRVNIAVSDLTAEGKTVVRTVAQRLVGSITVPAGGQVEGLHPAISNCAQVKSMLAKGDMEVRLVNEVAERPKSGGRRRGARSAAPVLAAHTSASDDGES